MSKQVSDNDSKSDDIEANALVFNNSIYQISG